MARIPNTSEVLALAVRMFEAHKDKLVSQVTTSESARLAAKRIIADYSFGSVEPVGVAMLSKIVPQVSSTAASPSANRTRPPPLSGAADKSVDQMQHDVEMTSLRRTGKRSQLDACAYCTQPWHRFCPESGRRHETKEEKSLRLWRTMHRRLQFSSKMVNMARLNKPNTCEEEFTVDIE